MKPRELIRKLRNLGFRGPYQGRRHPFMIRGSQRLTLPNPHGSDEIDISLVRRILRQAGIDPSDWENA
jgi:predicted RNA binding protein YcfA (HicA-like mRNA interferase family)